MSQLTITNSAKAKLALAQQSGNTIQIKSFTLTDSANTSEGVVGNEIYSGLISNIKLDENNDNTVIALGIVPSSANASGIVRKVYLYDTDDDLIAYGATNQFELSATGSSEAEISFLLSFSNADSISLVVPSDAYITAEAFDNHNHDDRYYLKAQVDTSLASKSNTNHNHDTSYYKKTELNSLLNGKSDTNHNHDDRYYLKSQVSQLINNIQTIPTGTILPFTSNTVPDGFILCQGASVSRSTYAELFAIIGTTFGIGNGSTTFNIPDLRGKFIRGVGGNSAGLGVAQGDAIRNISGSLVGLARRDEGLSASGAFTRSYAGSSSDTDGTGPTDTAIYFNASNQVPTAAENRPINMALNYIIKY